MNSDERHREILNQARERGRVEVLALAELFGVTTETVRRDLTHLERSGALRRVHGGAVPVGSLPLDAPLVLRDTVMVAEKERIAKSALGELPDEGSVIIDAGTTTARLAELLPTDRELTVIVNSPPIATLLASRANLQVIMLGGRVRRATLATVDEWMLQPLSQMYVDVAFVGASGISLDWGLTTTDPGEAAVKTAMMTSARHTVLMADHTKIDSRSFARFGQVSDVDVLITDSEVDAGLAAALGMAGPRVVRV